MNENKTNALLEKDHVKLLFSIFKNDNSELRLVGGSIRDVLINREIGDIDTATSLEPMMF